jgi:GNAT superfamily N-acetyltransferase
MVYEVSRDGFVISTDPARIDVDVVHGFLSKSYWTPGIPRSVVERGMAGSLCFGVYEDGGGGRDARPTPRAQIGYARVITDRATFAYLADVFILEPWRGRGLSKWLVETIMAHPELQNLRRWCLLTRDAQGLYARYGFKELSGPPTYMERKDADVYRRLGGG